MKSIDDVLQHYGIKGMKWGVRRDGGSDGLVSTGPSSSEDSTKAQQRRSQARSSGVSSLSNKELQETINRMNLELNYSRLTQETTTLDRGHSAVKKSLALGNTLNQTVAFAKSPSGRVIIKGLTGFDPGAPKKKEDDN